MFRAALTLFIGVVASGCCTQALCISVVAITLADAEVATLQQGPSLLRLCIDTACTEETVDYAAAGGLPDSVLRIQRDDARHLDKAAVTLTITRDGTERFTRTWQDVKFTEHFPNGPDCGGACSGATVDAT